MRQVKWTAKPARARYLVRALGALLLGTAALAPALAPVLAQVTPPDPATKAAMEKRTAARTLLSSSLARIAANSSDTAALLDAGRASIDLEDYRAALGFLVRAEQTSPRDGAIKAALGSAMVHMENPTRALDYFGEAQLMGAPERLFLADRGLARDLLGQQDAAQRDYQLALSVAPTAELTRRYALSLGISGDPDRAIAMLTPQLRAQDRGAWRLRAMILAMNGRDKEATEIVNATMPPAMAQNITPYLLQMDRLNPAQQAAAAHFGRFPSGQPGPKRAPVQVAAATPSAAAATGKPAAADRRRSVAAVPPSPTSAPAARKPDPAPAGRSPAQPPAAQAVRPIAEPPAPSGAGRPTPSPAPAAAAPQPIGAAVDTEKGPIGPGFSIADVGRSTPAASPPAPAAASAAPLASLADIVGSIEIPPEELNRPANAIGADTLARLLEDKRKAEAAEAAKREKEEAAAKAKAEADAKAKEEAAKKKANPARIWVQIATGANLKALAFDYNRFAKRNAALFKGKSGATAEWGQTRRLLVGPFANRKAAQDWLGDYKKAEGDGFLFDSDAGEIVEPIK
ncbi:Sporulation related [uncultured Sphingopyxis sp.]|uniref:Sporulation related n=1 Tax=uncultured Sphingopyxis sp. TaxID=310581 RepID=A0A1Y5PPS8_9SPHN|nr:SPOR domain-containing protein [uncultured Sphingopyxis sp.]SBV32038.1 Sporulation related [uncultured Sphingopyxis sp.]